MDTIGIEVNQTVFIAVTAGLGCIIIILLVFNVYLVINDKKMRKSMIRARTFDAQVQVDFGGHDTER